MRAGQFALLITALALAGCDRLTGADQKKILDAEAIGYACRVSLKPPEDCMKENETQSPTSVLFGWKEADKDIKEKVIDPGMGKYLPPAVQIPQSAPTAAETGDKTATGKVAEAAVATKSERPAAVPAKNEKPAAAKSDKPAPAAAPGKPDKGAAENKAGH